MQQTQKYKLNLIETSDTFSPDPLNENMEKVEAQLRSVETTLVSKADAAGHTALDSRVQALEAHRTVWGTYNGIGSDTPRTISLGFTPKVVMIFPVRHGTIVCGMTYAGQPSASNELKTTTNGFTVLGTSFDASSQTYTYLAFS